LASAEAAAAPARVWSCRGLPGPRWTDQLVLISMARRRRFPLSQIVLPRQSRGATGLGTRALAACTNAVVDGPPVLRLVAGCWPASPDQWTASRPWHRAIGQTRRAVDGESSSSGSHRGGRGRRPRTVSMQSVAWVSVFFSAGPPAGPPRRSLVPFGEQGCDETCSGGRHDAYGVWQVYKGGAFGRC
jgi:hypothetical protein